MKVTITFDTTKIFTTTTREVFEAYFRGQLTALDAARRLNYRQQEFERHLAAIFTLALHDSEKANAMATITVEPESRARL